MSFHKVAVIGAGTMGAGIAGQVANAGVDVILLDRPSDDPTTDANALAARGLQRIGAPEMPGLMDDAAKARITIGNTRDDLSQLADCDWVAEAVVERLTVKRALYARLQLVCRPQTIITSNTSTIPIRLLVEDFPPEFQQHFAITHFFNPVRFMRLLELVSGQATRPEVVATLADFCEQRLGKGVVICRDTPGFLGNRVGVYAIQCALQTAFALELTPPAADAVFGRPLGMPKTGVFGLYDLIGIDLMVDVVKSLVDILPLTDAFHAQADELPQITRMLADGRSGNKQGAGFYRVHEDEKQVLNCTTHAYEAMPRQAGNVDARLPPDALRALLAADSVDGRFAWQVLSQTLCYAATLIPEVGDDPLGIDDAMKLGYNWTAGPFEMLDALGIDWFCARLAVENRPIPEFLAARRGATCYRTEQGELQVATAAGEWRALVRPDGVVRFSEKKRTCRAENSNGMASWYAVDGVAVVEFHSKANALAGDSMAILADAITQVEPKGLAGLLVHNDAQHFSCGVNLGAVREYYAREDYAGLEQFLADFQRTVLAMRAANYPVVAAPVGLALGGGFEVVLHAQQVICHANSVLGLVESAVGVVPSGGGCKEMLYRWIAKLDCKQDISDASWQAFMHLGYAKTATSPTHAQKMAMLTATDRYEMNRDRLYTTSVRALLEAKPMRVARPPLAMPGELLFAKAVDWLAAAQRAGKLTAHDIVVGRELARIVTGGEIAAGTMWSEQDLCDAERTGFLYLAAQPATQTRINSMLDDGKVVRN